MLLCDCGKGLQLFNTSVCCTPIGDEDDDAPSPVLEATFFRLELPRRIFKLDFLDGAGDAFVMVISILVSCCSSSPDCSTHVGKTAEPVGECFIEPESLCCELKGDELPRSGFVINCVGRSRKILSSSAFNEPKTDGGVR